MDSRTLSRQELRKKTRGMIAQSVNAHYHGLPRKVRRQLIRETANDALRGFRGGKLVVTQYPTNWFQWLKSKLAPEWFLERYPVKTVER